MSGYKLRIVTPDGIKFEGEAVSLTLKTTDGELCIMAHHSELAAAVEACLVKLATADGTRVGACSGGFISVANNEVDLVATTLEFADEIDVARAENAKARAEAILENKNTDQNIAVAEMKLKRALLRLKAAGKKEE